jgi:hypothetical protein
MWESLVADKPLSEAQLARFTGQGRCEDKPA